MYKEPEPRLFRFVYRLTGTAILISGLVAAAAEQTGSTLPNWLYWTCVLTLAFGPIAFLFLAWMGAAAGWVRTLDVLIYLLLFLGAVVSLFVFGPPID